MVDIDTLVQDRLAYNAKIERAIDMLGSLGADLEGSVPYTKPYQEAADVFLDEVDGELSHDEIVELAKEWDSTGDSYQMMVGSVFLSFIK